MTLDKNVTAMMGQITIEFSIWFFVKIVLFLLLFLILFLFVPSTLHAAAEWIGGLFGGGGSP